MMTASALVLISVARLLASGPEGATLAGWSRYIAQVAGRIEREVREGPFLAIDAADRSDERRRVAAGAIVTADLEARDAQGREIDVPGGLVHDWRGDVFIPGATIDRILDRLQHLAPPAPPTEVRSSRIVEAGPGWNRIALILERRKVITVVYATEHLVTFRRLRPDRALVTSIARRITELDDSRPGQQAAVAKEDHGFLWRWNAYWRFAQTPDGVNAECESISLSRDVPAIVRFLARPIIRDTARESMTSALLAMYQSFRP
jgi:hypothetical protein